jgi:hypothetical protein
MFKKIILSISFLIFVGCSTIQYSYYGSDNVKSNDTEIPVKIIYLNDDEYYVFGDSEIQIAARLNTHAAGLDINGVQIEGTGFRALISSSIVVRNLKDETINVLPSRINLIGYDENGQLQHTAQPYKEVLKKIKSAQAWNEFANALSGAVNSYNAGYAMGEALGGGSTTTTETSGFVGDEYFTATSTTQNNPADDLANAATLLNANANMNANTLQKYSRQIKSIDDWFLKRETINSKDTVMGNIMFRTGKNYNKVRLLINIEDKSYEVDFYLKSENY